jgi:hypothetical protein
MNFFGLDWIHLEELRNHAGGGGSRIRTHEEVAPLTVFKTAAIDHSAIPPPVSGRSHYASAVSFCKAKRGRQGRGFGSSVAQITAIPGIMLRKSMSDDPD